MTAPRHSMLLQSAELHQQGERVAYGPDGDDDLVHGEVRVDLDFRDGVGFDVDVSDDGTLYVQYWLKNDRTPEEGDAVMVFQDGEHFLTGTVVERQRQAGEYVWWIEHGEDSTVEVWEKKTNDLVVIP